MQKALDCAHQAYHENEVPIGAIIVYKNNTIAQAYNTMKKDCSALSHAEIKCILQATSILKTPFLDECDLYVTLEPCIMCADAIVKSRIKKVYFGAYDTKGGGVDHEPYIFNNKIEYYSGIYEKKSQHLLRHFFQQRRL